MTRIGHPGSWAASLALAAMCLELTVSSNLLTSIGVPYVTEGGSLASKLHPGTDLLILAAIAALASDGVTWICLLDAELLVAFLAGGCCVGYILVLTGASNVIVLIDTFLPACLIAAVLCRALPPVLERLRRVMQLIMACCAALALVEAILHVTLIPQYRDDAVYLPQGDDFRPTALFDHPLTGGLMMMIGLALAPDGKSRRYYQCILWAALVGFGGRMALAASLAAVLAEVATSNVRLFLIRDKKAVLNGMIAIAGISIVIVMIASALAFGLGDRLATHLYWDSSAQVRVAQWQILDRLDSWQVVFGIPREQLLANLNDLRLASGVETIENFWLLLFLSLGVFGYPLFLAMFGALMVWCWKRGGRQGRMLLTSVLFVASTSNSIGRKSTLLVCLVAAISCLPRTQRANTAGLPRLLSTPSAKLAGLWK